MGEGIHRMKKLGILHISDIHINSSSISEIDSLVEKLIKDIKKVKAENKISIDLICFAGDLIGRGDMAFENEMQIHLAEEHFIQPLLSATGLTEKEFILVPGNHEVDKGKIAKRTEAGLVSIASLEEINETIFEMPSEYKRRLQYFYDYMHEKYISDADTWNLGYSILDIDMELSTCCIYSREYLKAPREEFDKALRINENGKVEYQLTAYDEGKIAEYDLKLHLREYYDEATEKYTMLKNIDSYSPDKIQDFFVEPTIFEKSEYERSELTRKEDKKEKPVPLMNLIQGYGNILIIGKKECGKTTILQKFGIFYTSSESEHIPIYIDMLQLNKGTDRILVACQNFIFRNMSSDMPITKTQIRNMLLNGKIICLFDNVNISNYNHIAWIQTFTKAFPNNRFIFAAEEKFYQTYTLKELPDFGVEYKAVYLECFGKRQVREMVTKWGKGKEGFDANEMTHKIVTYCNNINFAMTPFNIAVFMTIWDVDRNFVPINEGKVMRTYLETVLDKFSAEGFQRSEYDYDVKQHFLGYLAYTMCQKDEYFFYIDEFHSVVDKYHDEKGFKKSQSKFDIIFFEKNILCANGDYVYFSNTSIMEYCLASYALVCPALYKLMVTKGNRANFAHELSFYSGIVQDCSKLLNSLNDEITATILENMDILDEIEELSIGIEFNIDKRSLKEAITIAAVQ